MKPRKKYDLFVIISSKSREVRSHCDHPYTQSMSGNIGLTHAIHKKWNGEIGSVKKGGGGGKCVFMFTKGVSANPQSNLSIIIDNWLLVAKHCQASYLHAWVKNSIS